MGLISILGLSAALTVAAPAVQQIRFDDVVRNLRNPDPKVRLEATRLLREARYPEAVEPIAPLVNDPIDQIQLEAIGAELSFFLVEAVPARKRLALVVEVRNPGQAAAAFERGPLAAWPRPAPPSVIRALLQAIDDENPKVRVEAIYALGVIARPPFPGEFDEPLVKALDHYDPAIRAAAARVIGRLQVKRAGDALIRAINDSNAAVRYAAMRALGQIREERAIHALTEQHNFYGRGEGAWSALEALARIGHSSSIPLFESRLADRDEFLRRAAAEGLGRAGAANAVNALEHGAGTDPSEPVRAAMAFALQRLGRNYVARLAEAFDSPKMVVQVTDYLLELGPSVSIQLLPHLQDPDPAIRANTAVVLGALGGPGALAALQPLTQDRDRDVVRAATHAIERIKLAAAPENTKR